MRTLSWAALAVAALAGCSTSSGGPGPKGSGGEVGGSGGVTASGGTGSGGKSGTGGSTALSGSSGTGGSTSAGGSSASGGSTGAGGTAGGGHATGGAAGSQANGGAGGSQTTGGTKGSGGVVGSGGAGGTAGGSGKGGVTGSGGAGAGGAPGSGGAAVLDGGAKDVSAAGGGSSDGGGTVATPSFDWTGVVGSGQSLSVGTGVTSGEKGSTTQPYNNLMLSLGGATVPGTGANPWDSTLSALTTVPLVEPVRALETAFPSPYPGNIYGETPHAAMANQITSLVKAASAGLDYVTVHTIVGESGKGITALNKQTGSTTGGVGRAYAATLFEVGAITRLAKDASKNYGVGVVVMTHGETDCMNPDYKDQLVQLMSDYNNDIAALTGQTYKIPMYLSQQHGCPGASMCDKTDGGTQPVRPIANLTEWQLGVEHKGDFVCTGPKYQYPAFSSKEGIHLNVTGYQMLGEKTAQIYYQRAVLGQDWQPLQPTSVERSGKIVTVHFNVPVPPLNFDTTIDAPNIAEWKNGKGFELRTSSSNITIASVEISGDSVQITASSDLPTSDLTVGYALTSQGKQQSNHSTSVRWGQLRDSDPFTGSTTNKANPNYCVSFEMPVP